MDISERQNCPRSLDRLFALRLLYRRVKRVEGWRLVSVVAVVGLSLSGAVGDGGLSSQIATMVVLLLWSVDQALLVAWAGRMKEEAAAIQEDFDCFVLNLSWPEHRGMGPPTDDRVKELVTKGAGVKAVGAGVENWYSTDGIPTDPVLARAHCQRENCRWDGRLRKEWICVLYSVLGVAVVGGLVVAVFTEATVFELVLVVAGVARVVTWFVTELRAQSGGRKRMEGLQQYLSGNAQGMNECDNRLVQAAIFDHRRVSATVPDWFYGLRKVAHEGLEGG